MGASNHNVNHRASLGFSEAADFAPTQEFELTAQQLGGEPVQLKCACSGCQETLLRALLISDS